MRKNPTNSNLMSFDECKELAALQSKFNGRIWRDTTLGKRIVRAKNQLVNFYRLRLDKESQS